MAKEQAVASGELTVGEVAERSGVAVSALHFYEAQGLISSRRTSGNQRRYPREMLRRVAFIRASQGVGIPLRRIKAALDQLPDRRTPTRRDWERLSEAWRGELDDQIAGSSGCATTSAGASAAGACRWTCASSSTRATSSAARGPDPGTCDLRSHAGSVRDEEFDLSRRPADEKPATRSLCVRRGLNTEAMRHDRDS